MEKHKRVPRGEMPFLAHVEALRWHIIRSMAAVIILAVVAFFMKHFIFDTLLFGPKNPDFITYRTLCRLSQRLGLGAHMCIDKLPFVIQNRSMAGQFSTHIWASIIAGIIMAFPYILWELWRFIKPGLKAKEIRYSLLGIASSSLLFIAGILFGYFLIAPLSLNFLANYRVSEQIVNEIDLKSYIATILNTVLASGLVFQLPIIIFILSKIGLVSPSFLRKYRRHALIVIMVIAAIITPPDVSSLVLVTLPVFLLYEVSIFISAVVYKKRSAKQNPDQT